MYTNLKINGKILNKDGRIGTLEINDKGLVIQTEDTEKLYLTNEPLVNIMNDGWEIK